MVLSTQMPDLAFVDDFPQVLAPGEAFYVSTGAPAELEVPPAALRIRYYHQDRLGSSSVITDADGALVDEAGFYPYGIPRHEYRVRQGGRNGTIQSRIFFA